ncbi:hypothetical protein A6A19_07990 [Actinobacillus delphinicola]|uniref:L-lactate dehydrogenase n=1 Tax=Actinobacillus delphinicola TaxID=51161 RepID=A0A448TV33_9PAST|nr:YgjV family protein [Actinobacillus delphinicola]MDG6897914.1 hypothetical protein [Actinobacillus delphinicola]VEJ09780.1 Uncharacterised protein [Actinobacillus delphinicola]
MTFVDLLGYGAMFSIAIAFMMKDIVALRALNILGAVLFIIYSLLLPTPAYPVAGLNVFIALVNIYYVFKLTRKDKK